MSSPLSNGLVFAPISSLIPSTLSRRMSSADLPRDLVSCETSLSEHNDAMTEIRGKHDKFIEAERVGDKLIAQRNYNADEIKKCLQKLEKMEDEVSAN